MKLILANLSLTSISVSHARHGNKTPGPGSNVASGIAYRGTSSRALPAGRGSRCLRASGIDEAACRGSFAIGYAFDLDKQELGFGILTMQDYCGAVGGTLAVNSAPGSGTTVEALFPLPIDEASPSGFAD